MTETCHLERVRSVFKYKLDKFKNVWHPLISLLQSWNKHILVTECQMPLLWGSGGMGMGFILVYLYLKAFANSKICLSLNIAIRNIQIHNTTSAACKGVAPPFSRHEKSLWKLTSSFLSFKRWGHKHHKLLFWVCIKVRSFLTHTDLIDTKHQNTISDTGMWYGIDELNDIDIFHRIIKQHF